MTLIMLVIIIIIIIIILLLLQFLYLVLFRFAIICFILLSSFYMFHIIYSYIIFVHILDEDDILQLIRRTSHKPMNPFGDIEQRARVGRSSLLSSVLQPKL